MFGKHTLEYIKRLVMGHIDFLPRLQRPLLLTIIRYLELEDIASLARVSKQFREVRTTEGIASLAQGSKQFKEVVLLRS